MGLYIHVFCLFSLTRSPCRGDCVGLPGNTACRHLEARIRFEVEQTVFLKRTLTSMVFRYLHLHGGMEGDAHGRLGWLFSCRSILREFLFMDVVVTSFLSSLGLAARTYALKLELFSS